MSRFAFAKWTIGFKIRSILALAFLAGGILYIGVFLQVIYPSYIQLEHDQAVINIDRVIYALERELANLTLLCTDWADWDATYAYMEDGSPNYIKENYTYHTLRANRLNLVLLVALDGTVKWGRTSPPCGTEALTYPGVPLDRLSPAHLLHPATPTKAVIDTAVKPGVYPTDQGLMLTTSRPIRTSKEQGPSRGFLIMGRLLTPALIADLNRQTHVRFTLHPAPFQPERCQALLRTRKASTQGGAYCLAPRGADTIRIYADFPSITGETAFVIQADLPREIYRKGKKAMVYSTFALLLSLIITLALISFLLKRIINGPISDLKSHILNIRRLGDLDSRFPLNCTTCNDEILVLAQEFNGMLDRLVAVSRSLEDANTTLEALSRTDPLTHIANRREFDRHLQKQWRLMKRLGKPVSLIMCDVDYFKNYNDFYGHPAGDQCLIQIAGILQRCVNRAYDLASRYGGEEFALILPATDLEKALLLAETIRNEIEALNIPHEKSKIRPFVTLSMGVACLVPARQTDEATLVEMADKALYRAKESGRGRWETLQDKSPAPD